MCKTPGSPVTPEALRALQNAGGAIIAEAGSRIQREAEDLAHWNDRTQYGLAEALDLILRSLIGSMYLQDPALLDDQIVCINESLRRHGVPPSSLLHGLQILAETVDMLLPPAHGFAVYPYLQRTIVQQRLQVTCAPRDLGRRQQSPALSPGDSRRFWLA